MNSYLMHVTLRQFETTDARRALNEIGITQTSGTDCIVGFGREVTHGLSVFKISGVPSTQLQFEMHIDHSHSPAQIIGTLLDKQMPASNHGITITATRLVRDVVTDGNNHNELPPAMRANVVDLAAAEAATGIALTPNSGARDRSAPHLGPIPTPPKRQLG